MIVTVQLCVVFAATEDKLKAPAHAKLLRHLPALFTAEFVRTGTLIHSDEPGQTQLEPETS